MANYHQLLSEAREHIDNNRPIVLTMLNYNDTYSGGGKFIEGSAHVVVVYGYRMIGNGLEFLAHAGWGKGSEEVWFSENGFPFVWGFAYINAPLESRYNYTVLDNNSADGAVRLDGLKYQHSGALEIPSRINGMRVTQIGANAFSNQTEITSVTIPNTVTSIGTSAFANRTSITSVTFEAVSTLQTIGNSAFSGCTSLSILSIPSSVTSIEDFAFDGCSNLTSIELPYSLSWLGQGVFFGCSSLTGITIPYGVTELRNGVFAGCTKLTDITIPNGVSEIGTGAFESCEGLTSITIPSSVWRIGNGAFQKCYNLEVVYIERPSPNITSLGTIVFKDCISLTSIYVQDAADVLAYGQAEKWSSYKSRIREKSDFYFTPGLSFTLSGLEYIVSKGTANTNGTVYIPARYNGRTVTGINQNGFRDCAGLTGIVFEQGTELKNIGYGAFYGCSSLKNIALPESQENLSIRMGAFQGCVSLTQIRLPKNVTNIESAFQGCDNLKSVYIERPSSMSIVVQEPLNFAGCGALENIYVPDPESVIAYRNNSRWSKYGQTIKLDPEYSVFTYSLSGSEITITGTKQGVSLSGKVEIPSQINGLPVTAIGDNAFNGTGITEIIFENNNHIKSIGDYAFANCKSLTNFTILSGVTSIGDWAFYGNINLTNVNVERPVTAGITTLGIGAFDNCYYLNTINASDANSVKAYEKAKNWSAYKEKIQFILLLPRDFLLHC